MHSRQSPGYRYNLAGGLTEVRYPSGRTVSYSFDTAGRVSGVSGQMGANATNYASGIGYAPQGAIAQMTLNNGPLLEQACYNNRLQAIVLRQRTGSALDCATHPNADSSDLLHLRYDYGGSNNNGNLQVQTETYGSMVFRQQYGYDPLNRLRSASETGPGTGWSRSYGCHAWGNCWVSANAGVALDPFTPIAESAYDGQNHMNGSGAQYDPAGNQKQIGGYQSEYDAENRLISSTINSVTSTYGYDGEGRRVVKQSGGVTTHYVYDAQGQLAAEYTVEGMAPASPCQTCYLMADHLGSTRMMIAADLIWRGLHDYLPYGEEIPAGIDGRDTRWGGADPKQRFTGKERDAETGLDFFGARYFSSAQGRFTSPDDFLKDSDVRDPQSWNKYAYVRNNPLKLVDPKGEAATVSTTCTNGQDEQTTCQVNIQASVAIYAAKGSGLSNNQLKETAAAIKKGTEGSWQGTFTKDGVAYNVTSAVTVSIVGSEKAGVNSGAQNVIGITNGDAMAGGITSFVADRIDHPFSASDRGMFSYQAITGNNNTAAHEMGHLFGGRDFFAGDAILNQDPNSHSPRMTRTDFNDVLRSVSPQTGTRTVRAFWFGRLGF